MLFRIICWLLQRPLKQRLMYVCVCKPPQADMNDFLARLHNEPNLKVLRRKNRLGKVERGETGIPHLLLNIRWTAKRGQ